MEAHRWSLLQARDPDADGQFVYCVKTTKIYCRPVCKARLARRANVIFYDTPAEAEAAGFRPCKRCRPELAYHDPQGDFVRKALRAIEARASVGSETTLRQLASEAQLTDSYFHRVFKGKVGLTPKAYAKTVLMSRNGSPQSLASSASPASSTTRTGDQSTTASSPSSWEAPTPGMDFISFNNVAKSDSDEHTPEIFEVTIQPWLSSYILMVAADGKIKAIDVDDSYLNLLNEAQQRFGPTSLVFSDWSPNDSEQDHSSPNHHSFASIMEALQNPSGKILQLPPAVFEALGTAAV